MVRAGEEFAGYLIERRLGEGGMGQVYLARHPRLPRLVAVKVLARELAAEPQTRARFEREAELVARLDHPNIVTVHDRGVEDDRLWIAMQYVDGGDAAALDPRTLGPGDVVQIVAETAKALDYAHSMGVIHRDVKPANILLTRATPGHERRILLTDFGIGRLRDDSAQLTRTGTLAATLAYASPEQLSGDPLDQRSDQYSLACTFFRLLTGSTPYQAATAAGVIAGHLQHPVPRVTDRRPDLPADLDEVFARGLAKRPEQRYDSCRDFSDAAAQALSAVDDTVRLLLPAGVSTDPVRRVTGATRPPSDPAASTELMNAPSAGVINGGDAAGPATMLLTARAEATPADMPLPQADSVTPARPRRRRWITAGAGGLVVAIAAAVGIFWAAHDSGWSDTEHLPVNGGPAPAAIYPGVVPLARIDKDGKRIPFPASVLDPANDGRLYCKPVSIAAALPLSGLSADLGHTVLGSVRLAVSQFVQGGNNACPVTLREFDTASDQATAAQVAQRIAADDSIVAVIGPTFSGEVIAAGPTLDDAGLPFLTPGATNPVLAQSGWSGFFRGLANDNLQGPALGRYLTNTAGYSHVCVVRDNGGGYESTLADAVTASLGTATACEVRIDPEGDLSQAVSTITAAHPDAVYYSGYTKSAAPLMTKLRTAGVTAAFVLSDGSYDPNLRTAAGAAAPGTLVACPCGPATDRFITDYRTATGQPPTAHAAEAYDLTAIVLRGIVSGHTTRPALRTYLHTYHGDGIAHTYAWTPTGEPTTPTLWLYRLS
ncbi:ABC transporter substrate-binding protein [Nocardia sp. SYP-A9097]|uniref:bifunctional serine/threonine-protein kinase/ABC transporter substrate-binding protein n=1 Tax=Nocardia sp. SYP-A9097 TaxID=2663237 RepID=UPI00129A5D80|nr:bifunctional serine/threonine-protein kinase/ABC transporter substrate-binding protein [Nocardia sp. SYP-A9097]MRH87934.1 ABC transporter substrate-binding protein [Nocardia sp. SYP-A9097]